MCISTLATQLYPQRRFNHPFSPPGQHINGKPIACGGIPPVCTLSGVCHSLNYRADLCTKEVATPPLPAAVRIELLSASGYRLRGYEAASAVALTGVSGVALPARWGNSSGAVSSKLPPPGRGGVMIRVHLAAGAKLYAVNLQAC